MTRCVGGFHGEGESECELLASQPAGDRHQRELASDVPIPPPHYH
jgi:hypothetical protein